MNNNGYTRIPHELMRNPNLPPIAKVVWSLIAGMRPDFNATLSQYCKMVACHPDTWRSIIKMLELFGMVSVEHFPNGVRYSAITDTTKWAIPSKEGMKISHPMKISQGRKNSHPKGMKISHPSEEHKNNTTTTTTCACARERLMAELLTDARIELAMMQHHITEETYRRMVAEILADWQFRDLPESDYNLNHFSSVLRYKVQNTNRNNGNNQQSGQPSDPRAKLDADAAKAMATLASRIGKPKIVPF